MNLKVYGRNTFVNINVDKSFFETTEVKEGRLTKRVTPIDKADAIGMDHFGSRGYRGHVLEQDGKIISNTLGNRLLRTNRDHKDSSLDSKPSHGGFKFERKEPRGSITRS